ncbi:MAG: HAD-IA family hydrolase [Planctomycetota bacterium]
MLRAVSLDLGGTLLTESPSRYQIYAEEAQAEGIDVSSEEMGRVMGAAHARLPEVLDGSYRYSDPWFERFIREVFAVELGLDESRLPHVTERLFARFQDAASFALFPGIDALLTGLRAAGLRVGLLSNWSARLPKLLEAVGLGGAFDFVVCSAIDRVEKPDPAAFRLAAARAGVAPERCVHAGDRADLDGAAADVGMTFVLVRHGNMPGREPDDSRAAAVADGLPSLLQWVEEHL